MQNYRTADQSVYVGVQGANQANEYLRYKEELDRQRREAEEAKKKAAGAWWKRALINGVGGAVMGGMRGGIGGAIAGGAAGFGLSAAGDAAGMNGMSYGGGASQLGGAAGMAYDRWARDRGGTPSYGSEGTAGFVGPPQAGQFDYSPGFVGSNPALYDPNIARTA